MTTMRFFRGVVAGGPNKDSERNREPREDLSLEDARTAQRISGAGREFWQLQQYLHYCCYYRRKGRASTILTSIEEAEPINLVPQKMKWFTGLLLCTPL